MLEDRIVFVNGEFIPWNHATVHIMSHGFSRGSGIFEYFCFYDLPNGPAAFRMSENLKRLTNSASVLGLRLNLSREELQSGVIDTIKANKLKIGHVKIMAYYSQEAITSLVLDEPLDVAIITLPADADCGWDPKKTITACFSKWCKIPSVCLPAEAKACGGYVNGMLARADAQSRGFDYGILLDTNGFLAEGSIESVFLVKKGVLFTPALGNILHSITRKSIIEIALSLQIEVREVQIKPDEILSADEVFTANSVYRILPVRSFEERSFHPTPGPVSVRLAEAFRNILAGKTEQHRHWLEPLA
jgi:branched-chain amino acid aminotransferase